jgi:hypothetical protein
MSGNRVADRCGESLASSTWACSGTTGPLQVGLYTRTLMTDPNSADSGGYARAVA